MEQMTLDVFSPATNAAVVRAPGRRFPGLVVQGDTLSNLAGLARRVSDHAAGLDEDAAGDAAELADHLEGLLDYYTSVLDQHGHPLPFSR